MSSASRLWIVSVNYNSARLLSRFVTSSLLEPVAGLIILDNASTDADELPTLELIAAEHPKVTVIAGAQNKGFGAGVNVAVAAIPDSSWQGVWILNPDLHISSEVVEVMSDALVTNPGPAIFSPLITSPDGSIWFRGGNVDTLNGATNHAGFGTRIEIDGQNLVPTGFISGAAPLISRLAWLNLGGFREDLFLYWEDADISLRAIEAGVPLYVVEWARIVHDEGGSSGPVGRGEAYYYYMQRNRLIVCAPSSNMLRLLLFPRGIFEWARLLWRSLKERSGRVSKFKAGVRGLIAGLVSVRRQT